MYVGGGGSVSLDDHNFLEFRSRTLVMLGIHLWQVRMCHIRKHAHGHAHIHGRVREIHMFFFSKKNSFILVIWGPYLMFIHFTGRSTNGIEST